MLISIFFFFFFYLLRHITSYLINIMKICIVVHKIIILLYNKNWVSYFSWFSLIFINIYGVIFPLIVCVISHFHISSDFVCLLTKYWIVLSHFFFFFDFNSNNFWWYLMVQQILVTLFTQMNFNYFILVNYFLTLF